MDPDDIVVRLRMASGSAEYGGDEQNIAAMVALLREAAQEIERLRWSVDSLQGDLMDGRF